MEITQASSINSSSKKLLVGIAAWSWSILFSFAALGAFVEGSFFGGLLVLASAACAFPPLFKYYLKGVPRIARVVLAPVLLIFGIVMSPPPHQNSKSTSSSQTQSQSQPVVLGPQSHTKATPSQPVPAVISLAAVSQDGALLVTGRTNLPFGTELLVSIERPNGALVAQDKTFVGEFGRFYTNTFAAGGGDLPAGRYVIDITAAIADVQPNEVQTAGGKNWAHYVGPLMQSDKILGRNPNARWHIRWRSASSDPPLIVVLPSGARYPVPNIKWAVDSLKSRNAAAEVNWEAHREDAFFACQSLIKQNLRDPDSADFMTDYAPGLVSKGQDQNYSVVQRVRAANGFGGKNVSIFVCKTRLDGENWILEDIKELD